MGDVSRRQAAEDETCIRPRPAIKFIDLLGRIVVTERESHAALCVSACDRPSASRTWEGSTAPLEQAEPLDTQKPFRSSAITSDSPSMPSKQRFVVFGARSASAPLTLTSGTRSRMPCSKRSRRRGDARHTLSQSWPRKLGCLSHRDDSRRVFRSGATSGLMTSAEQKRSHSSTLFRTYSAPTPFGPRILCALMEYRSTPSSCTFTGIRPAACTPSECIRTPASRAIRAISRTGWIVPISLFTCITDTNAVFGRNARRTSSGSITPLRDTGTASLHRLASRFRPRIPARPDVRSQT